MVFQAITGAQTPACLFAASDPVETVTPPPWCAAGDPCQLLYYLTPGFEAVRVEFTTEDTEITERQR
jgi:hypothetical protein